MRILAAALLVLFWHHTAFAADPFVEATVATKGTLVAGQQIQIDIDVFVPNYFTAPPQFPAVDLPNAIVTLSDGRAQNLNVVKDGAQYSGIRRTYLVIPQLAGDYTLPTADIEFGYAAVPGQSVTAKVSLPPARFHVNEVPGSGNAGPILVATSLELSQTLTATPAN